MDSAYTLLSIPPPLPHTNADGYSVRSLYIPCHDFSGVLYRVNEDAYINHYTSSEPVVIKISSKKFLFPVNGDHHIFVQGFKYNQIGFHLHSGNPTVIATDRMIMARGRDVIRKVMLYPNEDNSFSVID